MSEQCRDCGAPVFWTTTLTGKRLPLNATPNPIHGDTFIAAADHGERLAIHVSKLTDEGRHAAFSSGLRLYRSHHVTCRVKRDQRKAERAAA